MSRQALACNTIKKHGKTKSKRYTRKKQSHIQSRICKKTRITQKGAGPSSSTKPAGKYVPLHLRNKKSSGDTSRHNTSLSRQSQNNKSKKTSRQGEWGSHWSKKKPASMSVSSQKPKPSRPKSAFIVIIKNVKHDNDVKKHELMIYCVRNGYNKIGLIGGQEKHFKYTPKIDPEFKTALSEFAEETGQYPDGTRTKYRKEHAATNPRHVVEYVSDVDQMDKYIEKHPGVMGKYQKYHNTLPNDKGRIFELIVYYRDYDPSNDKLHVGETTMEEKHGFKGRGKSGKYEDWKGEQEVLWLPISAINTETGAINATLDDYKKYNKYMFKNWQLPFIKHILYQHSSK